MIKWDWFWKLLKLSFFTLLISCFGLLGGWFVNWIWAFTTISTSWSASAVNSNYNISFFRKWWLFTQYLWQARSVIALDNNVLFWWAPNWFPYFYSSHAWYWFITQWFFQDYYLCDSLSWYILSWCVYWWDLTWDYTKDFLKDFFSTVVDWDLVYYDFQSSASSTPTLLRDYLKICRSSSQYNKSLCFFWWYEVNWREVSPLIDSQNYQNLTFSSIPYNSIWYAPWQAGYWWEWEWVNSGSSDYSWSNVITWDYVYSTCTNWYVKQRMQLLGMSPYLCYWWLTWFDILTWSSLLTTPLNPWEWETVFSIFNQTNDWKNFGDWFVYWNTLYNNRYTMDISLFNSKPTVLYWYFNLFNQYWAEYSYTDVQEYCRLLVNWLDDNASYNWKLKSLCGWVWWGGWWWWGWYDPTIDSEWNIVIWVNWDWVWSWDWKVQSNAVSFIQDFFNELKSVVNTDYQVFWDWYLPYYIITFMLAIIFFRFLSH